MNATYSKEATRNQLNLVYDKVEDACICGDEDILIAYKGDTKDLYICGELVIAGNSSNVYTVDITGIHATEEGLTAAEIFKQLEELANCKFEYASDAIAYLAYSKSKSTVISRIARMAGEYGIVYYYYAVYTAEEAPYIRTVEFEFYMDVDSKTPSDNEVYDRFYSIGSRLKKFVFIKGDTATIYSPIYELGSNKRGTYLLSELKEEYKETVKNQTDGVIKGICKIKDNNVDINIYNYGVDIVVNNEVIHKIKDRDIRMLARIAEERLRDRTFEKVEDVINMLNCDTYHVMHLFDNTIIAVTKLELPDRDKEVHVMTINYDTRNSLLALEIDFRNVEQILLAEQNWGMNPSGIIFYQDLADMKAYPYSISGIDSGHSIIMVGDCGDYIVYQIEFVSKYNDRYRGDQYISAYIKYVQHGKKEHVVVIPGITETGEVTFNKAYKLHTVLSGVIGNIRTEVTYAEAKEIMKQAEDIHNI